MMSKTIVPAMTVVATALSGGAALAHEHEQKGEMTHRHEASAEQCVCPAYGGGPQTSPLARTESILSVRPYQTSTSIGKQTMKRLSGAILYYRPEPGMTEQTLQSSLNQHLRFMRANPRATSEMPDSPLNLENVRTAVVPGTDSFYIYIYSNDSDTAKEILRRARLMVS
jgi:hypothetical protein